MAATDDVCEVIPGLYLGGLSSLKHLDALHITHVMSVVNFPVQKDLSAYTTLQIPLQDSEGANMLQYLPAAIKFLDAALPQQQQQQSGEGNGASPGAASTSTSAPAPSTATATASIAPAPPGTAAPAGCRVLVHCQAGVSRSVAVVAGWLMRSRGLSADAALSLIRAARPSADPNEGFRAQLDLFGDMRCSLDAQHPVYRMWCLEELNSRWEEAGWVDPDAFAPLPEGPGEAAAASAAGHTLYRCRKCRQLLATSQHVVPVEAAMGHRVFRNRQRRVITQGPANGDAGGPPESCLFVEPLQWMAGTVTGEVQGKLHCPKCAARLGSFNWSGISNPSGAWVTPAFQLHTSKMDSVPPRPLAALGATVRVPLLRPAAATPAAAPAAPAASTTTAPAPTHEACGAGGSASGTSAPTSTASTSGQPASGAPGGSAPSLPSTLPAQLLRMGLGLRAEGEEDEEQLPEPQLDAGEDEQQQQPQGEDGKAGGEQSGVVGQRGQGAGDGACGRGEAGGCEGLQGAGEEGVKGVCRTRWFTHLLLDCDGVLVDSEAASCEALRRGILEVTGTDIPHAFPQDFTEVFGMDVRSCVAHYREKLGRQAEWDSPEALAPRVQEAKEQHYKQLTAGGVPPFDGAARLIRRAQAAGMSVAVASSGAPAKIHHNLSSAGLLPLLPPHVLVSAAHVAAGKPAPDVYLRAMEVTGCTDPRRALVVEDAVNGLKAARAAGAFAVAITNSLPARLLAPWADLVVTHLDQVDPVELVPNTQPANTQ